MRGTSDIAYFGLHWGPPTSKHALEVYDHRSYVYALVAVQSYFLFRQHSS